MAGARGDPVPALRDRLHPPVAAPARASASASAPRSRPPSGSTASSRFGDTSFVADDVVFAGGARAQRLAPRRADRGRQPHVPRQRRDPAGRDDDRRRQPDRGAHHRTAASRARHVVVRRARDRAAAGARPARTRRARSTRRAAWSLARGAMELVRILLPARSRWCSALGVLWRLDALGAQRGARGDGRSPRRSSLLAAGRRAALSRSPRKWIADRPLPARRAPALVARSSGATRSSTPARSSSPAPGCCASRSAPR